MAVTTGEIEVFVMVNDEGEYVAHEDEMELAARYEEMIGELGDATGLRTVRVKLRVTLPTPIEVEGEVAVEESAAELKVA